MSCYHFIVRKQRGLTYLQKWRRDYAGGGSDAFEFGAGRQQLDLFPLRQLDNADILDRRLILR
jgi:hypothetical protein